MLKKTLITLVVGILVSLSFTAAAATAADQPIRVYFDDELLQFEAEPFLQGGSTMVPFRAIFERLGLTISFDPATKKVTGKKDGLSIELVIGRKTAIINGEQASLSIAPVMKDQITFIPLRFVIENADKEVSWDSVLKQVYIADTEQQIYHALDKYFTSYAQNYLDMTLTEPEYEIQELKGDQASVQSVYSTRKLADSENSGTRVTSRHRLVRMNEGWKLQSMEVLFVDYMKQNPAPRGEVLTSATDQQAIRDVLAASQTNFNNEDMEAEKALYLAGYPNLELALAAESMTVYDLEYRYGNIDFLSGSETEATVRYSVLTTKINGPTMNDSVSQILSTFKKNSEGKWKIATTELLNVDYRTAAIVNFRSSQS